jgi:hypothetical protein
MQRIGIDPVPRFPLGEMIITPGVASKLGMVDVKLAIAKHASGDWGELEAEDRRLNNERLANGGTLFSIFKTAAGVKFYVMTEAERDRTTVLLPEEY